MRIGIDFDNTIVCYDGIFYDVAIAENLSPTYVGKSKQEVKDYLCEDGRETDWTNLQGKVYGSHIAHANPYAGVIDFVSQAQSSGHRCFIISHRSQFPYAGELVDLHKAAGKWLEEKDLAETIGKERIFFKVTKAEKIATIGELECDVFIDDLDDIVGADKFPHNTQGILFDPNDRHLDDNRYLRLNSWSSIANWVQGQND